jgi:hypothetical protein
MSSLQEYHSQHTYHGQSYIRAALWPILSSKGTLGAAFGMPKSQLSLRLHPHHLALTPNISLGRNPKARQERADLRLIRLSDERLDLRLRAEQPGDFAGDVRADVPRISHQIGRWCGGRRELRVRGLVSDGLFLDVYVRHASSSVLCGGERFCFSEQPHQLVQ